jgi:uncharacterized protein (DUF1015 family)
MILQLTSQNEPFSMWNTIDGREHALWKIKKTEADLAEKFEQIDALYILDGHHRLEAASHNYELSSK